MLEQIDKYDQSYVVPHSSVMVMLCIGNPTEVGSLAMACTLTRSITLDYYNSLTMSICHYSERHLRWLTQSRKSSLWLDFLQHEKYPIKKRLERRAMETLQGVQEIF